MNKDNKMTQSNITNTTRCTMRVDGNMIMITGNFYDDGTELWFVDSHPHITGHSEAQLEARVAQRGLWDKDTE